MVTDKRSARCSAAMFLLVVCAAAGAARADVMNGNFEEAPNRSQMNGSAVTGPNALPYWTATGYVEYIESGQKQGDMMLAVPEGRYAVRLGNDAAIQQQLGVARGAYYSFTFSASRTCGQDEKLDLTVIPGSQNGEIPIQTVYTSCGWDAYCWAFKANSDVVTLTIRNPGQYDDPSCGPIVDAITMKTLNERYDTQYNMLKNGDFEEGPYIPPNSQSGVLVPPKRQDRVSPLPGWKIMSDTKGVRYIGRDHFAVPQGEHAVELVSGPEAALVQDVDTVANAWYKLSFTVGDAGDGCAAPSGSSSPMQVRANAGRHGTTVDIESWGSGGSKRAELVFQAADSVTPVVFVSMGTHTKSDNSGTLCGPVLDDVSLVATSQPPARRLLL
ncbi:hypothetical protein ACP70R_009881 [Stipagrostis hirtigluma subsp. patula]